METIKMPLRSNFQTIEEWCDALNKWIANSKKVSELDGQFDWGTMITGHFRSLCNYEVTEYYVSNEIGGKKHKGVKRLEHWGSGGAVYHEGYDLKEFYDETGKDVINIVSEIDGNYYVEYPEKNNTNKINWVIIGALVLIGVVFFAYIHNKQSA